MPAPFEFWFDVRLDARAGIDIEHAIIDARRIADQVGRGRVTLRFNGIDLAIEPQQPWGEIAYDYVRKRQMVSA
jgi:hypothetical protein